MPQVNNITSSSNANSKIWFKKANEHHEQLIKMKEEGLREEQGKPWKTRKKLGKCRKTNRRTGKPNGKPRRTKGKTRKTNGKTRKTNGKQGDNLENERKSRTKFGKWRKTNGKTRKMKGTPPQTGKKKTRTIRALRCATVVLILRLRSCSFVFASTVSEAQGHWGLLYIFEAVLHFYIVVLFYRCFARIPHEPIKRFYGWESGQPGPWCCA